MKYQEHTNSLKNLLDSSENILITLVKDPSIDELAAGLATYLTLEQQGKKVSIASEGIIRVSHSHLYGINHVESGIPNPDGGNLTIVLSGVVDSATSKPTTLQELKWHPEGSDLHLVFYPVPGQRFEPTHITPGYEGAKYDLIMVFGAKTLADLGAVYQSKTDLYAGTHIVNIDNDVTNSKFGQTVVVDPEAASLSEMAEHFLESLGLPPQIDAATNILNGIYSATDNLKSIKVSADTFLAVSSAIRAGGNRPTVEATKTEDITPDIQPEKMEQTVSFFKEPIKVLHPDPKTESELKPEPPVVSQPEAKPESSPEPVKSQLQSVSTSPEEAPIEEGVETVTPESDWLTPKIFRGSSIG